MGTAANSPVPHSLLSRGISRSRQQGASLWSLLLIFLIGGLAATCTMKMGPVYFENWNLRALLEDVQTEFSGKGPIDKTAVRTRLRKRMNIDMIDSIDAKDITIEREGDSYNVTAKYEARIELLGNIDVVMKFDDSVSLSMIKE